MPETTATALFGQSGLKERTGNLLGLVDQEGEHDQEGKDDGEMILPMTEVMLKLIALILEGIEGLIFDFPARPTTAHDVIAVVTGEGEVSNPGEILFSCRRDFPVFEEVDQQVRVGGIEGNLVDEMKAVGDFAFDALEVDAASLLFGLGHLVKEIGMVADFDTQNEV